MRGIVNVSRSYTLRKGVGKEKDTKTHQMRRIALDTETIAFLREHKQRCVGRMADLGLDLTDDMYVFGGVHEIDPATPYSPHAVSSRYKDMAERLGIETHIHALRHYSATEFDGWDRPSYSRRSARPRRGRRNAPARLRCMGSCFGSEGS